jgi:hypothetical protein
MYKKSRLIAFDEEGDRLIVAAAALSGRSVTAFVRAYAVWAARMTLTGGDAAKGAALRENLEGVIAQTLADQHAALGQVEIAGVEAIVDGALKLAEQGKALLAARRGGQ